MGLCWSAVLLLVLQPTLLEAVRTYTPYLPADFHAPQLELNPQFVDARPAPNGPASSATIKLFTGQPIDSVSFALGGLTSNPKEPESLSNQGVVVLKSGNATFFFDLQQIRKLDEEIRQSKPAHYYVLKGEKVAMDDEQGLQVLASQGARGAETGTLDVHVRPHTLADPSESDLAVTLSGAVQLRLLYAQPGEKTINLEATYVDEGQRLYLGLRNTNESQVWVRQVTLRTSPYDTLPSTSDELQKCGFTDMHLPQAVGVRKIIQACKAGEGVGFRKEARRGHLAALDTSGKVFFWGAIETSRACHPDGRYSGRRDGTCYAQALQGGPYSTAAWSSEGHWLVAAGAGGVRILLWHPSDADEEEVEKAGTVNESASVLIMEDRGGAWSIHPEWLLVGLTGEVRVYKLNRGSGSLVQFLHKLSFPGSGSVTQMGYGCACGRRPGYSCKSPDLRLALRFANGKFLLLKSPGDLQEGESEPEALMTADQVTAFAFSDVWNGLVLGHQDGSSIYYPDLNVAAAWLKTSTTTTTLLSRSQTSEGGSAAGHSIPSVLALLVSFWLFWWT